MKMRVTVSPRIARGPVVLNLHVTANAVFVGNHEKVVVNLDKATLKEVWRRKTKLLVRGGLPDVVFLGNYHTFEAWNEGGEVLWHRDFPQKVYSHGERLYLHELGMQVLDLRTAALLHRFDSPDGSPGLLTRDLMMLTHRTAVDPVYLIDLRDGRILWEKRLAAELHERHGIDPSGFLVGVEDAHDRAVLVRREHVVGMSLRSGELLWSTALHVPYYVPQVKDGRAYVWTMAPVDPGVPTNRLIVLDTATGRVVADRALESYGDAFRMRHEPRRGTLCQDHIVFTTDSGLMAVFRLSDGELVWHEFYESGPRYPIFDDGRLYACCTDGTVAMFEPDGARL